MSFLYNKQNRGPGVSELFNNVQSRIVIYSFSADKMIYFPAFVTDFSDAFTSNWNSTEVYGKMDPISTFKSTTRVINISFDIPNFASEILYNNSALDDLISGLYPIYNKNDNGTSLMTSPPLFRIKFANLIENNGYKQKKDKSPEDNSDDPKLEKGLLGFFKSFDYKPDFTQGVYELEDKIFPKLIKVSLSFNVIHEHSLGNQIVGKNKSTRNQINGPNTFPHRFSLLNELIAPEPKPPPSAADKPKAKPPAASGNPLEAILAAAGTAQTIQAALEGAGGVGASTFSLLDESNTRQIAKIYEKRDNPPAVVSLNQLLNTNFPKLGSGTVGRGASLFKDKPIQPRPRKGKKGIFLASPDKVNLLDNTLKLP